MNKLLLTAMVFITPLAAFAEQGFYIQGQINKVFVRDLDGSASGTVDGVSTTLDGEIEYDESTTAGIEIGMKGIADTNWRAGIQYIAPEFEFRKAKVTSATIDGTNYAADLSLTRDELKTAGVDLDADAKMLFVNGYYDFVGHWDSFVPFLGAGIGGVEFDGASGTELGVAAMIGFKKYVTDSKQLYIGHKSSFTNVNGPTVRGVEMDDLKFYTATFQLGYEF